MDMMKLLAGGAIFGFIAGCWDKIKAVLWRFVSLLIQRVEIIDDSTHRAIVSYLVNHHKRSPNYDRLYGAGYEYNREGKYGLIPYEHFGQRGVVFWIGWFPLLFRQRQPKNAGDGQQPQYQDRYSARTFSTLTFVRGTIKLEKLICLAVEEFNHQTWNSDTDEENKKRFAIYYIPDQGGPIGGNHGSRGGNFPWYRQGCFRLLAHRPEQLGRGPTQNGKALDNLIYPPHVLRLIKEIELWRNSKEWYQQRGIPWKRGWLLHGPPGTGKTALARAFAEDLDLPIYVFNLTELNNQDFFLEWRDMQVNIPCLALIEDIDNVFHGRKNVARRGSFFPLMVDQNKDDPDKKKSDNGTPLTFDALLNCLDGVERSEGIFTIITTNDISKIDAALGQPRTTTDGSLEFISTRPGRIDKAIELTYMEPEDKKRMAKKILGDYADQLRAMIDFIDEYPELQETPAQFQERCAQVALLCYWKEKEGHFFPEMANENHVSRSLPFSEEKELVFDCRE